MEVLRDPAKTPVNQRDRTLYIACPNGHALFANGIKVGTLKKKCGVVLMESQRDVKRGHCYKLTDEQWKDLKQSGQRCMGCE